MNGCSAAWTRRSGGRWGISGAEPKAKKGDLKGEKGDLKGKGKPGKLLAALKKKAKASKTPPATASAEAPPPASASTEEPPLSTEEPPPMPPPPTQPPTKRVMDPALVQLAERLLTAKRVRVVGEDLNHVLRYACDAEPIKAEGDEVVLTFDKTPAPVRVPARLLEDVSECSPQKPLNKLQHATRQDKQVLLKDVDVHDNQAYCVDVLSAKDK